MSESKENISNNWEKIHISTSIQPTTTTKTQPGDLSQFFQYGNSFQASNPFKTAPQYRAEGGVIYFDNDITKENLETLLRIMKIQLSPYEDMSKKYAVYVAESKQPHEDGYLTQLRIVSRFALRFVFITLTDDGYETFPKQELSVMETFWAFIQHERKRWGTSFTQDEKKGLMGLFGGDGDYAREQLSFGIVIEDGYHHIYRIFSRAWLVTK